MNKKRKKLLIGGSLAAAASITVLGIAVHNIAKYFTKVAFDRNAPRGIQKAINNVSGKEIDNDVYEVINQAAVDLEKSGTETVEISSYDGQTLVGHLLRAENPKRIIIAMHGWRASWTRDFGVAAPFWHQNDCTVLFVEQRGQGKSGGEYMGFGLTERYDCLEWIKWAIDNVSDSLPIYLSGISMGASTVLMAAGLDLPSNVHGITADCGYTSVHDIFKHVTENNLHLSYGLVGMIAKDMCKKKINFSTDEYSTLEAMKNCKVPILFIHGTDDTFVPVWMTYENYKACASKKNLLIVPGAEHGMCFFVDRPKYIETVKAFWREND